MSNRNKGDSDKSCNCRNPRLCPLNAFCLTTNVIHKCIVEEESNLDKVYIGSTVNFKARYRAHMNSFSNEKYLNSITLVSYIHGLRRNNKSYS